jgi:hypothetical protein
MVRGFVQPLTHAATQTTNTQLATPPIRDVLMANVLGQARRTNDSGINRSRKPASPAPSGYVIA